MAAAKTVSRPSTTADTARLKVFYKEELVPRLREELGLKNVHQVPKLEKIVLNVGLGKHKDDKSYHEAVVTTLRKITGQQPVDRMAKKSIATFKIRRGMNRIGVSVTLRDQRMYEFLDRLIHTVLPRVRDFHGVSTKAFDQDGNYSLGLTDQSVFPELGFEDTTTVHGLQVNFVIKAQEKAQARVLLAGFGLPFEKENR